MPKTPGYRWWSRRSPGGTGWLPVSPLQSRNKKGPTRRLIRQILFFLLFLICRTLFYLLMLKFLNMIIPQRPNPDKPEPKRINHEITKKYKTNFVFSWWKSFFIKCKEFTTKTLKSVMKCEKWARPYTPGLCLTPISHILISSDKTASHIKNA